MTVVLAVCVLALGQCRDRSSREGTPEVLGTFHSMIRNGFLERDPVAYLVFGEHAVPDNYVDTVYGGSDGCTAILVDAAVILTAKHCVPDRLFYIQLTETQTERGFCKWYADLINTAPALDLSLCWIEHPSHLPPARHYETIGRDPALADQFKVVLLAGFGFTGRPRTKFGVGAAIVWKTADTTSNMMMTTKGAQVTPGDSGGPAFAVTRARQRFLVGVNARTQSGDFITSYVTDLTNQRVVEFATAWLGSESVRGHATAVCGITANASELCRR
jgi:hypothetical protein